MSEVPTSLAEMQNWFGSLIAAPIQESDEEQIPLYPVPIIQEIRKRIAPSPTLKSEERMGIYQQQYWWRLLTIMQELFPSLVALLGAEEFNRRLAEPYLAEIPPADWAIGRIGDRLPAWLEGKEEELYIELARLDLECDQLLFVYPRPPVDSAAQLADEDARLYLQGYVRLYEVSTNLFVYREQLLKQAPLPPIKKYRKKKYIALYRYEGESHFKELTLAVYALLKRFQAGATLGEVAELLEGCGDVVALFRFMAERAWLSLCPSVQRV